jgi:hypothetical protein
MNAPTTCSEENPPASCEAVVAPPDQQSLRVGLPKGVRSSLVLARNPSRSAGRYCIRLSRVLTSAISWARLRLPGWPGIC